MEYTEHIIPGEFRVIGRPFKKGIGARPNLSWVDVVFDLSGKLPFTPYFFATAHAALRMRRMGLVQDYFPPIHTNPILLRHERGPKLLGLIYNFNCRRYWLL